LLSSVRALDFLVGESAGGYARIAGIFSDRVHTVPSEAWDNPSPCEDWTARDVVGYLTGWIQPFFSSQGVEFPVVPSVDDDPAGAWDVVQGVIVSALADPDMAAREAAVHRSLSQIDPRERRLLAKFSALV
jgi:hypothetical protein